MNIDNLLSVHSNALHARIYRTSLLATNIANSDTPNYKARDIAFGTALQQAGWAGSIGLSKGKRRASLNSTHAGHISTQLMEQKPKVLYRQPNHPSLDGNTVDKDAEQARFAENSIRYQASINFVNNRISSLVRAIRGE